MLISTVEIMEETGLILGPGLSKIPKSKLWLNSRAGFIENTQV